MSVHPGVSCPDQGCTEPLRVARIDYPRPPREEPAGRACKWFRASIIAALCALLTGCGADSAPESASGIGACIVGGSPELEFFGLDGRQRNAIAAISVWAQSSINAPLGWCTGTLIGSRWLLTARHCAPEGVRELRVLLGTHGAPACGAGAFAETQRRSRTLFRHPSLDVLLVELDADVPEFDYQPFAIDSEATFELTDPVELAGYGETDDGSFGRLMFATSSVVTLADRVAEVRSNASSGACSGDSGGPLFRRGSQGEISMTGVLSEGDPSCTGRDYYVRTSAVASWVSSILSR